MMLSKPILYSVLKDNEYVIKFFENDNKIICIKDTELLDMAIYKKYSFPIKAEFYFKNTLFLFQDITYIWDDWEAQYILNIDINYTCNKDEQFEQPYKNWNDLEDIPYKYDYLYKDKVQSNLDFFKNGDFEIPAKKLLDLLNDPELLIFNRLMNNNIEKYDFNIKELLLDYMLNHIKVELE